MQKNQTQRPNETPVSATAIAGSSHEFDMADMLIAVKRDATTGQMTTKVLKSRW